jgi:hypothetical protein
MAVIRKAQSCTKHTKVLEWATVVEIKKDRLGSAELEQRGVPRGLTTVGGKRGKGGLQSAISSHYWSL